MSADTSMLTTVFGWSLILGAAGIYYIYNSNKSNSKAKPQPSSKQLPKPVEDRKEPKAKKSKKDGSLSSGDQDTKSREKAQKQKKMTNPPSTQQKLVATKAVTNDSDNDEDAETNRQFALQLAQAQAGTKFSAKPAGSNRQKSVKQSHAQEKRDITSGNVTAGSATGGDADDDQSSTNSPEVGPTNVASPVANGISDMLEAQAPGPSILKVMEPSNSKPTKKENAKPASTPAETKKQRQNRRKVEEAKIAREQAEKERKVLEEKQRRTAREAEGRAPKDGRQFMASQQPATSAWPANGHNTGAFNLLDTAADTLGGKATAPSAGSNWVDDDDKTKLALEESREWEQVSNKKRKPKKEKKENSDGEAVGNVSSADDKERTVPPVTARTGPGQKWTTDLAYIDKNDKIHEVQKEVQDSEWVVS